jgi:hypothetical protein
MILSPAFETSILTSMQECEGRIFLVGLHEWKLRIVQPKYTQILPESQAHRIQIDAEKRFDFLSSLCYISIRF